MGSGVACVAGACALLRSSNAQLGAQQQRSMAPTPVGPLRALGPLRARGAPADPRAHALAHARERVHAHVNGVVLLTLPTQMPVSYTQPPLRPPPSR